MVRGICPQPLTLVAIRGGSQNEGGHTMLWLRQPTHLRTTSADHIKLPNNGLQSQVRQAQLRSRGVNILPA